MKWSDARWLAACWIAWILAGLLPALFFFRFLYADGAYFFLRILEGRSVFLPAEGRAATYVLTQWPAPLAMLAGCADIRWLAWCFGAGLMLVPTFLHGGALWLLLRRGMRLQALVYLVMLWLLMGFSGLCIVTDSHTPAAVFLLAVALTASSVPDKMGSWAVLATIGALSVALYEFWAFYSPALMVLLVWRLWPQWPGLPVRIRLAAIGLLGLFAASGGVHAWRLLHSSGNSNQASLLQMLDGTTYPIYLFLIAAWFAGLCIHFALEVRPGSWAWLGWIPAAPVRSRLLGVAFAALAVLCAVQHATMVRYSYPFRTLNLILPLLYAGWLMSIGARDQTTHASAEARIGLVLLTGWLLANENWNTLGWRKYQAWAGEAQGAETDSLYVSQPPETPLPQTWIYPWSHSAQSFVAQALWAEKVNGIGYDPGAGWDPYGPGNETRILKIAERHGICFHR